MVLMRCLPYSKKYFKKNLSANLTPQSVNGYIEGLNQHIKAFEVCLLLQFSVIFKRYINP